MRSAPASAGEGVLVAVQDAREHGAGALEDGADGGGVYAGGGGGAGREVVGVGDTMTHIDVAQNGSSGVGFSESA